MIAIETFSLGVLPVDGLIQGVHNGMQFADQVTLDISDTDPPPRPKVTLDLQDNAPPPRPKFELIVGVVDTDPPPRPKITIDLQDNDPPPPPKR